jgi:hypothetical protein
VIGYYPKKQNTVSFFIFYQSKDSNNSLGRFMTLADRLPKIMIFEQQLPSHEYPFHVYRRIKEYL